MSRPTLPNSPLAEVVCEIRFHGELSHLAGWGFVQKELRHEYPKLLVPALNGNSGNPPWMQPLKLASDDERNSVLLSINSLSLSTKEYSSYERFHDQFVSLFRLFEKHCPIGTITRIAMRYTNRLPPVFGDMIDNSISRLHPCLKLMVQGIDGQKGLMQPQFVAELLKDGVNYRLALISPQQAINMTSLRAQGPALLGVHLDLSGYIDGHVESSQIADPINRIHAIIEDGFLSIITDEYHQYLKGENSAG